MPHLEEITPQNFDAAVGIRVRPDQEHAVSPVMRSLAEAYVHPAGVARPRLIVDGERPVGFLMAFFEIDWHGDGTLHRSGLWRLNIAADAQGHGYGRFAVRMATGMRGARPGSGAKPRDGTDRPTEPGGRAGGKRPRKPAEPTAASPAPTAPAWSRPAASSPGAGAH